MNNLILNLSESENSDKWLEILDNINHILDSFESQFKQLNFRLIVFFWKVPNKNIHLNIKI